MQRPPLLHQIRRMRRQRFSHLQYARSAGEEPCKLTQRRSPPRPFMQHFLFKPPFQTVYDGNVQRVTTMCCFFLTAGLAPATGRFCTMDHFLCRGCLNAHVNAAQKSDVAVCSTDWRGNIRCPIPACRLPYNMKSLLQEKSIATSSEIGATA